MIKWKAHTNHTVTNTQSDRLHQYLININNEVVEPDRHGQTYGG